MALHAPTRPAHTEYRADHRPLLVDVSAEDRRPPRRRQAWQGGIVLPVARSFAYGTPGLHLAIELARARDCRLVVLCSKKARVRDFPARWRRRLGERLVLVQYDDLHPDWTPELACNRHPPAQFHRSNDAAHKRNAGLLLAARLGWRWVLFLDDDIFENPLGPTLDLAGMNRALVSLERDPGLRVIGWSAGGMEDHSIVGHARKLVGMPQESFIGSGAMLARLDGDTSFFPNLYNQDWIFQFFTALRAPDPRAAIGWAGQVRQASYEPYLAARGKSEEVGDLVGEFLLNLLEDRGAEWELGAGPEDCDAAVLARRRLLQDLSAEAWGRLTEGEGDRYRLLKARQALFAAGTVAIDLTGPALRDVLWALNSDQSTWLGHLVPLLDTDVDLEEADRVVADFGDGKPPTPAPVVRGTDRPC